MCEKERGRERGRRLRAPPPRSVRRSSCSQTNCSILFTAATEQKSGSLLEYLFGIVQCHTKGVSLCWGGEKSPSPFFSLSFYFFFLFSADRNNNLKLSLKSFLSIINFIFFSVSRSPSLPLSRAVCMCVRARVCVRGRERASERESANGECACVAGHSWLGHSRLGAAAGRGARRRPPAPCRAALHLRARSEEGVS